MTQNMVILGIGGDPSLSDSFCTMLGVGNPDAGPAFSYKSAAGVTLADLSADLAQSAESHSFVVTALSALDSGVAYVAESRGILPDAGLDAYDTQIASASEGELNAQALSLADAGY